MDSDEVLGTIGFNNESKVSTLWSAIADGNYVDVDYFDSLADTMDTIKDELEA